MITLIKFDQFNQVWSNLFYFIPIWSSLIQFDPIWSKLSQFIPIWSSLVNLIKFDPILSTLFQFDQVWSSLIKFDPIWSNLIQFEPISSCFNQFINLMQFEAIWSNLKQFYLIWIFKSEQKRQKQWQMPRSLSSKLCLSLKTLLKFLKITNFFQNHYWGATVEELFAYIFGIYKKIGGNNPSILTPSDSVSVAT